MACLRKVGKMASDTEELYQSAVDKVREFQRLEYPTAVLREACRILGVTSEERTWFRVRHTLLHGHDPEQLHPQVCKQPDTVQRPVATYVATNC